MALAQVARLEIDGGPTDVLIRRVHGRESTLGRVELDITFALGRDAEAVAPASLVGAKIEVAWLVGADRERVLTGVIDAAEVRGAAGAKAYVITVIPRARVLEDTCDYRVFVDQDALAIVEKVLGEHQIRLDRRVSRSLEPRPQCVQNFESDLEFARRLLAEEGLLSFCSIDEPDVLVVIDSPSAADDAPCDPLPLRERAGLQAGAGVFGARVTRRSAPGKVTLRDYDFTKPELDLTAENEADAEEGLEVYEYPGLYKTPSAGATVAGLRLEEARSERLVLEAETTSPALAPGYVITIEDPAGGSAAGRWLVLDVTWELADRVERGRDGEGERYLARFRAVRADAPYRPKRPDHRLARGIETATVTGSSGAEIHTEAFGRARVHMRWDRRNPLDDTASTWVRVAQPPTSGGFFMPRVGWEAVLGFYGSTADAPVVAGRVYNGIAVPPEGLPGTKVVTAFGTATTPGGGGGNNVRLSDAAGNEEMTFHASKDFNERTENDKVTAITANDTWSVSGERKLIVGQVLQVGVKASQTYTVSASRTLNVTSNYYVKAASESVMVGGVRIFNVGGDHATDCATLTRLVGGAKAETGIEHAKRQVLGASTVLVGGKEAIVAGANYGINVAGAYTEVVSGAKSIKAKKFAQSVKGALNETFASRSVKAGGDRVEDFAASATYTIGGSANLKGSDVVVKATSKITIKAGGVTIEITPGSITVDGQFKGDVKAEDDGDESYE